MLKIFRASQFLQNLSNNVQQMNNLSLFLATQNKIKEALKAGLQEVYFTIYFFNIFCFI